MAVSVHSFHILYRRKSIGNKIVSGAFYVWKKIQKKYKTEEKKLAIWKNFYYTNKCCDMIAMKREVAAYVAGFPWSECQVRKLTTSHCITSRDLPRMSGSVCRFEMTHTGMCTVAACRTTKSAKRRRLFLWQVK